MEKSLLFFSKSVRRKGTIASIFDCKVGSLPVPYLGLPLCCHGLKMVSCAPLIDKMAAKLNSWNGLKLSLAGRVELVKSVLTSFTYYWCSAFDIPAAVIGVLERKMRNFIWGSTDDSRKLHHLNWDILTSPKAEGGFGIRKVSDINHVSSCKLSWDFIRSKDCLWVAWFNYKYNTNASYWNSVLRASSSCIWNRMVAVRQFMLQHISYRVGSGTSISLFDDPWCQKQSLIHKFSYRICRELNLSRTAKLDSLIVDGRLVIPSLHSSILMQLQNFILSVPIHDGPDKILWDSTEFSFKKALELCPFARAMVTKLW